MAERQPVNDEMPASADQQVDIPRIPGAGIMRPPSAEADARASTPTPMLPDVLPAISIPPPPAPALTAVPPALTRSASVRQATEDFDPSSHDALYGSIPAQLRSGTAMLKVSAKKVQRRVVKLKAEAGQVLWESKHAGMRE